MTLDQIGELLAVRAWNGQVIDPVEQALLDDALMEAGKPELAIFRSTAPGPLMIGRTEEGMTIAPWDELTGQLHHYLFVWCRKECPE